MKRAAGYLIAVAAIAATALFVYSVAVSLSGRYEGQEQQSVVFLIGLSAVVAYLLWTTARRLLRREERESDQ